MTKILGIETTCDETSAAVVENGTLVLSNILSSQAKLHSKYGGIVPEVASRKHLEMLPVVVDEALIKADIEISKLDAIAISKQPGLPPALSVGYAYASGLASGNNISLIDVDHLEAHVCGIWLIKEKKDLKKIPYPFICLLVSGGHTQLRLITNPQNQKILGSTLDDATGEAFDKVGRLLGLPYPGGPKIDKLSKKGDETSFNFPRPMLERDGLDFSFSGLKTAVKREVRRIREEYDQYKSNEELFNELNNCMKCDIAASFQEAVVDVLVKKTIKAAQEFNIENIAMAGGVSANSRLRDKLGRAALELGLSLHYPEIEFCLDNGAMVAAQGFYKLSRK